MNWFLAADELGVNPARNWPGSCFGILGLAAVVLVIVMVVKGDR